MDVNRASAIPVPERFKHPEEQRYYRMGYTEGHEVSGVVILTSNYEDAYMQGYEDGFSAREQELGKPPEVRAFEKWGEMTAMASRAKETRDRAITVDRAGYRALYEGLSAAIARLEYLAKHVLPQGQERQDVERQLETLRLTLTLVPPPGAGASRS